MTPAQESARWRAIGLGHRLDAYSHTNAQHASAECTRPGCNMGFSVTPAGAVGSAVMFDCAGNRLVAESQTS